MYDQLLQWKKKDLRRRELKDSILQKQAEMEALEKSLFSLGITANNEQFDVEQLKRFTLKNLYYSMTGKKEELLAKETMEARAANAEFENTKFHVQQLHRQIEAEQRELEELASCGDSYHRALQAAYNSGTDLDMVIALTKEYLQAAADELNNAKSFTEKINEGIENTYPIIENTRQWNSSLSGTAWTMSVPGYLNGVQSKMNLVGRQIDELNMKLTGLQISIPTDIYRFDKDHFREIASRSGAEVRLAEARNILRTTQGKLTEICTALNNQLKLTEEELSQYR